MLLPAVIVGIGVGLVVYWLVMLFLNPKRAPVDVFGEPVERPWWLQLCGGVGERLGAWLPGIFGFKIKSDAQAITLAGLGWRFKPSDILGMQVVLPLLAGLLVLLTSGPDSPVKLILLTGLAIYFPKSYVKDKKTERQQRLRQDFPLALDILCVAVGAGNSIGAAVKRLTEFGFDGPLDEEFKQVFRQASMSGFATALRDCSERIDTIEIKAALSSLVQCINSGGSVVDVLRTQSQQLRYNRLMAAEEAAQKIPGKLMIPMILCFLPATFLFILGPIVVTMIQGFKGF